MIYQHGTATFPTILVLGGFVMVAIFGYTTYLTFQGAFGEKGEDDLTPFPISSFEECENAGYPVGESYPRQCFAQGKTFVEDITNTNRNSTVPEQERCAQDSDCVLEGCLGCTSRVYLDTNPPVPFCERYAPATHGCACSAGACVEIEKTSGAGDTNGNVNGVSTTNTNTNSSNVNAVPIELQPTPIEGECGDGICEAGEQCNGPCYFNPDTNESYCLDSCGEQYCNEDCG